MSNMTDEDLKALFEESDEFDELVQLYDELDQPAKFKTAYNRYYTKWIQSQGDVAPRPAGPMDDIRRVAKIATTDEEIRADIRLVNPKYNDPDYSLTTSSDPKARENRKSRINCQRCVVAQYGRNQGYDVEAVSVEEGYLPVSWDSTKRKFRLDRDGADSNQIAESFVKEDGTTPVWIWTGGVPRNKGAKAAAIEAEILSWGEGAEAVVFITYPESRGAHVFNARVKDGKVLYTDSQPGQFGPEISTGLENNWKTSLDASVKWNGVLRIDGTTITEQGKTWVRERSPEQINAPTEGELTAKIDNKTVQEQIIWNHVWHQVRSGDRVQLPVNPPASLSGLSSEQIKAIAREAWTWARRPD
jgi:hypothetical protein